MGYIVWETIEVRISREFVVAHPPPPPLPEPEQQPQQLLHANPSHALSEANPSNAALPQANQLQPQLHHQPNSALCLQAMADEAPCQAQYPDHSVLLGEDQGHFNSNIFFTSNESSSYFCEYLQQQQHQEPDNENSQSSPLSESQYLFNLIDSLVDEVRGELQVEADISGGSGELSPIEIKHIKTVYEVGWEDGDEDAVINDETIDGEHVVTFELPSSSSTTTTTTESTYYYYPASSSLLSSESPTTVFQSFDSAIPAAAAATSSISSSTSSSSYYYRSPSEETSSSSSASSSSSSTSPHHHHQHHHQNLHDNDYHHRENISAGDASSSSSSNGGGNPSKKYSLFGLTHEEVYDRKREQNKNAARRYRAKKLKELEENKSEISRLECRNTQLRDMEKFLAEQIAFYKSMMIAKVNSSSS